MNTKAQLFLTFFKIGLFTFGGGYAMIPLIKSEAADKKGWITQSDMLDIVAISESTPGPIAVNAATFVGCKTGGVLGSACATLGVVLPSFLIIALLGAVLDRVSGYKAVSYAFFGIRAGVLALIVKALIGMYKKCPKEKISKVWRERSLSAAFAYLIMLLSFCLVFFAGITSPAVLLLCASLGVLVHVPGKGKAG